MIQYIKGIYGGRFPGGVILEANGIGYMIHVPENSSINLAEEGQPVKAYTRMIFREDDVSLYGFSHVEELRFFDQLITVNGVGAKAALSILSILPPREIQKAILFQDVGLLTRANGIGKKTAERIVLELKDKIDKGVASEIGGLAVEFSLSTESNPRNEAITALLALGYSRSEAIHGLSAVTEEDLSTEEYIKKALSRLF
ncbi:MAG: Holliday junction branch migration protein RuvA [Clostridia bacterium]|jgi:Holliday junction DNA helicase RuvA|nr:Holliday junction branch migration protein RuvA [Clostridia bacterium]